MSGWAGRTITPRRQAWCIPRSCCPADAPDRLLDRSTLWNKVEAGEKRKDAQLAREVEFALPRELTQAEAIGLAQDFVREQFVARGMVADLNVHWAGRRMAKRSRMRMSC